MESSIFSNLILDVADIKRSLGFYHGLLKLPVWYQDSLEGNQLATLHCGDIEICLVEQPKKDQPPARERSGGMVIKFYVRNLSHLASELVNDQMTILQSLELPASGERTLMVADPDGYAVLLAEPVSVNN